MEALRADLKKEVNETVKTAEDKVRFGKWTQTVAKPVLQATVQLLGKIIGLFKEAATKIVRTLLAVGGEFDSAFDYYNAIIPRGEAKGKSILFRSRERRLRLVAVAATRQQQFICRAYSRQLHIWIDQQRGNMLPTHIHPVQFPHCWSVT